MKKIGLNIFLILLLLQCSSYIGMSQVVKVYPYYVEPTEYPDYSRRPFKTPTWKTFNDTVQFVGGRTWGSKFGQIEEKSPNWLQGGAVFRPNYSDFLMGKDSLRSSLERMKRGGKYLFNINAYGPGTPVSGGFGQFKVEKWKSQMMSDILEDRYMGFDLGEQDGRYWADCRSIDFPMSSNYQERYLNAMKYMHRAAIDQGDIISLLSVKWFWHYPVKDGFITISGAESQNKTYTSNDQIHYAFLRGASKQYGTLWYGDISVFNTWGWKTYGTEINKKTGPNKGNSIAWMKRMLFSQYQYNSTILGFEGSKFYKNNSLSPIGMLQTDMQEFVKSYPKPGPQHTPVAFMLDFFSGWMTPSERFRNKFKVWNLLPYKQGDYFTNELLDMFYNGYIQTGLHENEYGGLCNTPYGDALDVLLSDAKLSTLKRYQMLVVAGELVTDLVEIADKLENYINQGGHLVITSENAQKLFASVKHTDTDTFFFVDEHNKGKGKMTVIYSPNMGLDENNQLVEKMKVSLDILFQSTRLFSVRDSLGYVTNIEGNGNYMLGIYNHSLESKPFKIESHVGKIISINELNPVRNLTKEPGYFPDGFEDTEPGLSNKNSIAAGDLRLFFIKVEENKVEYMQETHPEKRVANRYISVPSLIGLQNRLQTMPTFFDYFSGIKVNWKEVLKIDQLKFNEDAWWYNLKQLQVAIEFDSDFYNLFKTNADILPEIVKTLSASKYVNLLLFSDEFPEKLKNELSNSFTNVLSVVKSSNKIFVAKAGEVTFPKQTIKPILIEEYYTSWNSIYRVARAMNNGEKYIVPSGDYHVVNSVNFAYNVKPENANFYFSYHNADKDIASILTEESEYLKQFGGVKIDGTYLLSRSLEKCKEESELLQKLGLKVIVDLCREINNYPNLTWLSEIEHSYKRSTNIHDNILQKMQLMDIGNVIIGSHMRPEQWQNKFNRTPEESIVAGMSEFIKKANSKGITVSIQNRAYRLYPSRLLANPEKVSELVSNFVEEGYNVKYAAHLGLGENPDELLSIAENAQMNICIVAAKCSNIYDYRIPVLRSKEIANFKIDKKAMLVFDADYNSVNELIEEKNRIIQHNLKHK